MALVLQGVSSAVCSFPCNHNHTSKDVKDTLEMKGGSKVCSHLTSSIGFFDMNNEESQNVTADMEFSLDDLSAFFTPLSPLLTFKWKRISSSAKGTKSGNPDEFDASLEFRALKVH